MAPHYIEVGHSNAVEVWHENGKRRVRKVPGERVTTFYLPEGTEPQEAVASIIAAMPYHEDMRAEGSGPQWIEGSLDVVVDSLREHYGIPSGTIRPLDWGSNAD